MTLPTPPAIPLESWGWDSDWAERLAALAPEGGEPARVVSRERDRWTVQTASGPVTARLARRSAAGPAPAVGDWVVVARDRTDPGSARLSAVLPRRSAFVRAAAGGGTEPQVLAANVDRTWIVHGLDLPPNLRRLERYLALAWESGSTPEIVLTKSDLAEDLEGAVSAAGSVALGTKVWVVSAADPATIDRLRASLRPGSTVALLGPSGAGKSTLVNHLARFDVAATGEVREWDHKGRHTTTRRELYRIPEGALVIDTPGLRELRIWDIEAGLSHAFPDIEELAAGCHFRDCGHESEPGCAVLEAVKHGSLAPDRLGGFRKLRAEAAYEARKADPRAAAAQVSAHKTALKTLRFHPKYKP